MQIVERKNRSFVIDGIVDREVRARNFGGEEKRDRVTGRTVNSPGYRNFLLFINEEIAEELKDKGCEVKYTKVQGPNDVPMPYVSITISYFLKPVEAHMISKTGSSVVDTPLDENHLKVLNSVDIGNMCVELECGKEKVHNNGTRYVPIYAQCIWVEVIPNYIAEKYAYLNNGPVMTAPGTEEDEPF